MPLTHEQILNLYDKLLAARQRNQKAITACADAWRLNQINSPEWERIQAERHDAFHEYHLAGMEWLQAVGLRPYGYGGCKDMNGMITAFVPPLFDEEIRLPGE